jgi:glutamate-5-semialdehyde dehydrogenase
VLRRENMSETSIQEQGIHAKAASRKLAVLSTVAKNEALKSLAEILLARKQLIISENIKDIEEGRRKGLSNAMLDRLLLNETRIEDMAKGLVHLINLPDPVGEVMHMWQRPNELQIGKMRVPLGVIGIIYEARPNVTVDAAGLCLKSGNAVLLRGGSEAIHSNKIIVELLREALKNTKVPIDAVQMVETTEREAVDEMLKMHEYLDVLIPRGGSGLIQYVVHNATVPVIETGIGNCHVYIDAQANLDKGVKIVYNAKTQRPAVCNAMETLLVHEAVAETFLPQVAAELAKKQVELRGCPRTKEILGDINLATEEDYATEFLDYILAIKVVSSVEEAVEHIEKYGSRHSEAIITENYTTARYFQKVIDAAAVYINASTRFTDGAEFGFGAEMGISTQKLHARGPMGLTELTTIKYVIYGDGQIRD